MKRGEPMKRTEIQRRTPLRSKSGYGTDPALPKHGRSKMRPISPKRAREARAYTVLRRDYLTAHPRCEFPGGCVQPATEIHHKRGRVGALFLDVSHWSALCHDHHAFLTVHPAIAYEMGMSERRIGGAA